MPLTQIQERINTPNGADEGDGKLTTLSHRAATGAIALKNRANLEITDRLARFADGDTLPVDGRMKKIVLGLGAAAVATALATKIVTPDQVIISATLPTVDDPRVTIPVEPLTDPGHAAAEVIDMPAHMPEHDALDSEDVAA